MRSSTGEEKDEKEGISLIASAKLLQAYFRNRITPAPNNIFKFLSSDMDTAVTFWCNEMHWRKVDIARLIAFMITFMILHL